MKLRVSPTRMELIKLKKRLILAYRGHKLLKDKQEQLNTHFFNLYNETKKMREKLEISLNRIYNNFLKGIVFSENKDINIALTALPKPELKIQENKLMNISYLSFDIGKVEFMPVLTSNIFLDKAIMEFIDVFPEFIKLACYEKLLELLAYELQRTRRRVNALEYVLIPSIQETVKFITNKFNEIERDNITRLMKIKEMRLSST